VAARDEHLVHAAGVDVGAAELDGSDAAAVLGGQVADGTFPTETRVRR
jgi:hypothetical protein